MNPIRAAGVIALLALVVRGAYWGLRGTQVGQDTPGYLDLCGEWASDPLGAATQANGIDTLSFTFPLCAVNALPGDVAPQWVLVQLILSALGCGLLFDACRRLLGMQVAWIAGLIYALLWEAIQWDVYVLTDSLFIFYLILLSWLGARLSSPSSRSVRWGFGAALVLVAFARPTGAFVAISWLFAFGFGRLVTGRAWSGRRTVLIALPLVVLLALAIVGSVASRGILAGTFLQDLWASGVVMDDDSRWDYHYAPSPASSLPEFVFRNAFHLCVLFFLKVGLLFVPITGRFSTAHNVLNGLTLAPVMALGIGGWTWAVALRVRSLTPWLLSPTVSAVLTGLTFVDYDWRYRLPLLPFLAVGAGFAIVRGAGKRIRRRPFEPLSRAADDEGKASHEGDQEREHVVREAE